MIARCKMLYDLSGVDAIVIAKDTNLAYFTGYANGDSYLIINDKGYFYITDDRYVEKAQKELKDFCVVSISNKLNKIKEMLAESKTVGIENTLTIGDFIAIFGEASKINFNNEIVILNDKINKLRNVKTDDEIACLQMAIDIAEESFKCCINKLYTGITELQFCRMLENTMLDLGAEGASFDTIIAFGENSSVPHHKTSDRALKENEPILIDYGCKIKGYCSDITRTIVYGSLDSEFENVYNIVNGANELAFKAIKNGAICSDIDKIAREFIDASEYKGKFIHSLGHGIGLDIHEYPVLNKVCEEKLEVGNVVTDEPGIYLAGKFGVRIEDDILVTDTARRLTTLTRDLLKIDIKKH